AQADVPGGRGRGGQLAVLDEGLRERRLRQGDDDLDEPRRLRYGREAACVGTPGREQRERPGEGEEKESEGAQTHHGTRGFARSGRPSEATMALRADVAELVDAHGSGPCGGNPVEVQVLSSALFGLAAALRDQRSAWSTVSP